MSQNLQNITHDIGQSRNPQAGRPPRLSTGPAELERICEALAARREPYSVAQLTSFARRLGVGVDALGSALAAAGGSGGGGGGMRGMEVASP